MLTSKNSMESAADTVEPVNTSWNIINNTGIDIVVIGVFPKGLSPEELFYMESLETLQTDDGTKFLKAGTHAIFSTDYQDAAGSLIIAKANNLFPVKIIETLSETSVLVSDSDLNDMQTAEKFQKVISAFPSSTLAQEYATVLSDDPGKADDFFKGIADYKNITLTMVVAVQSYQERYAFTWLDYKDSKSYFLYASDGRVNSYLGSVTFSYDGISPLDTGTTDAGFSFSYLNAAASAVKELFYKDGQFADDQESGSPAVCLQGLYMLKSQLTKTEGDNTLISILTGVVDGKEIIGYENEQKTGSNGIWTDLDILVHPENAKGWIELIGIILAGILGLAVLSKSAKSLIDLVSKQKPQLSPDEIKAKNLEIREQNRVKTQAVLDKINKSIKKARLELPEDVNKSLKDIKNQADKTIMEDNRTKLRDILDKQQSNYNKISEYSQNASMEKVYENLGEIYEAIQGTDVRGWQDRMAEFTKAVKESSKILETQAAKIKSELGTSEKKAIESSQEAVKKIIAEIERNEEIREELREEEIPEIIEE